MSEFLAIVVACELFAGILAVMAVALAIDNLRRTVERTIEQDYPE